MKVLKQGVSLFLALIMVLGMLNGFVTFADSPETEGVSVAEENQEKKDEFVVETDDGEMLVAGKEALPEENPADVEDDDKNDEEKKEEVIAPSDDEKEQDLKEDENASDEDAVPSEDDEIEDEEAKKPEDSEENELEDDADTTKQNEEKIEEEAVGFSAKIGKKLNAIKIEIEEEYHPVGPQQHGGDGFFAPDPAKKAGAMELMSTWEKVTITKTDGPENFGGRYQSDTYVDARGASHYFWFGGISLHRIKGQIAYCIEPNNPSDAGRTYTQNDAEAAWAYQLSSAQREAIALIMAYGYPTVSYNEYGSGDANHMKEAATQLLIWEIVAGYRSASAPYTRTKAGIANAFGLNGSHAIAGSVYNDIVNKMVNHGKIPSFSGATASKAPTITLKYNASTGDYRAVVTDSRNVLSQYNWTMDNVNFNKSGNTLTISTTKTILANSAISATGHSFNATQSSVIPWSPPTSSEQALAMCGAVDPMKAYIKLEVESVGKAQIKKVDAGGDALSGFKFKLYNRNNNMSFYGKTGRDGRAYMTNENFDEPETKVYEIPNLHDGTYRFKEVEPGGYSMSRVRIYVQGIGGEITEVGTYSEAYIEAEENGDYSVPLRESANYFQVTGLDAGGTLIIEVTNKRPNISTVATNKDNGSKSIDPAANAKILDKVTAGDLTVGHVYYARGVLCYLDEEGNAVRIKEEGQDVIFESEKVTATSSELTLDVNFTFDASAYAGKTIVVYEYLKDQTLENADRNPNVGQHTDKEDQNQMITVRNPEIRTSATDKADNDKIIDRNNNVTIVDTVTYTDLTPGVTYTLRGRLMDSETSEVIVSGGAEVTATKAFRPEASNGSTTLEFTFDASAIENPVVVFEKLFVGDSEIASHEDISDLDQTLNFTAPVIHTTAAFVNDQKVFDPVEKVKIIDVVAYENVIAGKTYELKGMLVDKATGVGLKKNNEVYYVSKEFVPPAANGTVNIEFEIDARSLAGKDVVVFEYLFKNGDLEASHEDINDIGQTVSFTNPSISTSASDGSGNKKLSPLSEISIVDNVTYSNLIPGKTYSLKGVLMDKETNQPITVGGAQVTASKSFTPTAANGTEPLTFSLNATSLKGKDVVVFEELLFGTYLVAEHKDINDTDQTVTFPAPRFSTQAKNKDTNTQVFDPLDEVVLVDTISYRDFAVGKEYRFVGTIMDKETGEPLMQNGNPIQATKTVTLTAETGSVEVEFTFSAKNLKGRTLVVYEEAYFGTELIGEHKDLNDAGQTVRINNPEIQTTATNKADGSKVLDLGSSVTLQDVVSYTNLTPGKEYVVKGVLMDKQTNSKLLIDGHEVTAEKTFTPESANGSVTMDFTFNSSSLQGKTVVVFESLYRNNIEIAVHADINDAAQTVEFNEPKIGTKAANAEGGSEFDAIENVTLVDTVSYSGLVQNQEYRVDGVLMDKATGNPFLVNGEPVKASKTFIAEGKSGSVEVEFTFNAIGLKGKSLVVFETLYLNNIELAVHADINDKDQTITFNEPEIQTEAKNKENGTKEFDAVSEVTIVDTVSYTNLIAGKEYTVSGVIMDKNTNEPLKVNGATVTASKTFTPAAKNGSVEIEFTFNASDLKGKSVVVFENLYREGVELAVHADINDEAQTVEFKEPDVQTEARNKEDGSKVFDALESVTIVDTVKYTNLTVGKEYRVEGILMDQESGEPLLIDGETVTAVKTFIPTASNGETEMEFTFNAIELKGKKVVVFEDLYFGETKLAVHADINDEAQTVEFMEPKIATSATDKSSGERIVDPQESVTIEDTVTYQNLIPNKTYVIRGVLMDRDTGDQFMIDGTSVAAEKVFQPEEANGSIKVEFTFPAEEMRGRAVVVFEKLYRDEVELAQHEDLEDDWQTVTFTDVEIGTKAENAADQTQVFEPLSTAKLIDHVSYRGLIVGKEYTVTGVLMDKETGEPVLENGEEITSEVSFTAEESEGVIDVEFEFDASLLRGKTMVVFEAIYRNDILLDTHADIEDEDQTVTVLIPEIGTQAFADGRKIVDPLKSIVITDTVSYHDLKVGETYELVGIVMDKETEKAVSDVVVVEFEAEDTDGEVEVEFTFDGSELAGKSLVVFEYLYREDELIAYHEDLEDEDQTVVVNIPEIGTTASFQSGSNIMTVNQGDNFNTVIIDKVEYHGLTPGVEYTVSGVLMNKATGQPFMVNGQEVTAVAKFTPEEADGFVEVKFTVNVAYVTQNMSLVVFESCYNGEDLLSEHKDINDSNQTVSFTYVPKTGGTSVWAFGAIALACLLLAAALMVLLKKNNGKQK